MEQVINHTLVIEGQEYECKIKREATGFMKSECRITIFAPTEPPKSNWQEMFFNELMIENGGEWKFINSALPKRIIDLESNLTIVINQLTNY